METLIENKLITLLEKHSIVYFKITSKESLYKIYNLFNFDIVSEAETDVEHVYFGIYYKNVKRDYKTMKMHYKTAISQGHPSAMNNLGCYYLYVKSNHAKAVTYYLMGIEHGNEFSMSHIACYYRDVLNIDELVVKYFTMAIDNGHVNSLVYLAHYYKQHRQIDKMKELYLRAIEKKCILAMQNLGDWYDQEQDDSESAKIYYLMMVNLGSSVGMVKMARVHARAKEYDEMKHFYTQAIEQDETNVIAMCELAHHYEYDEPNVDKMKEYLHMAAKLRVHDSIIKLARHYSKERNFKQAFDVYMIRPVAYELKIKKLLNKHPDLFTTILVEHKESKDTIDKLTIQIEELKSRQFESVFESCQSAVPMKIQTNTTTLTHLPPDIIVLIFKRLPLPIIPSLARTSLKLNQMCLNDAFWRFKFQEGAIPIIFEMVETRNKNTNWIQDYMKLYTMQFKPIITIQVLTSAGLPAEFNPRDQEKVKTTQSQTNKVKFPNVRDYVKRTKFLNTIGTSFADLDILVFTNEENEPVILRMTVRGKEYITVYVPKAFNTIDKLYIIRWESMTKFILENWFKDDHLLHVGISYGNIEVKELVSQTLKDLI